MNNMQVYLGVWTNWSRGAVMGATLTTTREYGNLLIAFTAFFIPFVATRFWRICCFFLHRIHSTPEPKGAIHHQRQVLLRNAASMESALVTLFSLVKSWHARKHAKLSTLLPLFGFTIFIVAAFTVAGGFSSRISSGISDEVLIDGNNCGIVSMSVGSGLDSFEAFVQYVSRAYTDAANYVQQCYSEESSGVLDCDRFVVKQLKTETIQTNRSCPFRGDICRSNNTNIRLDTGYIDSHDHLGLNTPPNERIAYRYVLECAPLKTEGYVSHVVLVNVTWAQYHYGTKNYGGTDNRTSLNYTHQVQDLSYQYPKDYIGQITGDLLLSSVYSTVENGKVSSERSAFLPIPALVRTDGDVSIIFLSGNGVYFLDPLDDDWYRATVQERSMTSSANSGSRPLYRPVDAASPLGCVEQWQWCNSNYKDGGGCGPLTSALDALNGASHLFKVPDVWQGAERPFSNTSTGSHFIWTALIGWFGDEALDWAVKELKSAALASRSSSFSGVQYGLPNNQWHLDVQGWWNTILAKTQGNMINAAIGHIDPILRNSSYVPTNQYEKNLCYNQKVRSTGYTSFSLFGLYFTYITGGLIVLVSLILEPIFDCLHSRSKYKQYKHLEWTTNETLQLHRLAHEGAGSQQWSGCTESAPTTAPEASLASLNIEDLAHPVLARTTKVEQEVVQVTIGSLDIDLGAKFQLDMSDGKTAVYVKEGSEESADDDLTDNFGQYSSTDTIGYYDSQDSLHPILPTAHSVLSDHAANYGTRVSPNLPWISPTGYREERFRQ
ncbi:hypothetical protein PFICI_10303 [Pestalotiopsis fici W106-1]|uniref:Uncharacterized protein n=1 Tax=Pestalotiopsis fici (strain W106-1 / CGMCC3.15140) TaxID=1229662 RepID=W3WZE3_PESFW|nr:uncharacterized protein PFICI_10303 [Pestalotiopsis fici W106-1]ETS78241.1 hypothetical protein PFICI_10303 [Pestalotiopsis fici W106-1]